MKLSEIIHSEEYSFSRADENAEIKKIVTKTDDIEENTLLIIPNSSKLSEQIKLKAPPLAIACDDDRFLPKEIPEIILKNTRLTLSNAYHRFFGIDLSDIKTVAVTGTNGKTSTSFFIKETLKRLGKKVGYIGTGVIESQGRIINSRNYSMTTPDAEELYSSLQTMENDGCEIIVMEVSSHALALEKVAPLFFDYALFTNFSSEHSDFHPSKEDYFSSKCKLFNQCKCAVINIDDEYSRRIAALTAAEKIITAGVLNKGDVYATHIENLLCNGSSYIYHSKGFLFRMKLGIPGIYNVYNSMLASTVCIDMGFAPCKVKDAISEINLIPGRFEIIKSDITVIIDFAHTEFAFESFLREARAIAQKSSLHVIFGCGGERDKKKRPVMARISEKFANKITVTSDNPRNEEPEKIIRDITEGFSANTHKIIYDRREAIFDAVSNADQGDVIAVVGKGMEKYIIDKNGYQDFDEKAIINEAIAFRKESLLCESN